MWYKQQISQPLHTQTMNQTNKSPKQQPINNSQIAEVLKYCLLVKKKGKGKWCVAKYGDPYSEFVLCI